MSVASFDKKEEWFLCFCCILLCVRQCYGGAMRNGWSIPLSSVWHDCLASDRFCGVSLWPAKCSKYVDKLLVQNYTVEVKLKTRQHRCRPPWTCLNVWAALVTVSWLWMTSHCQSHKSIFSKTDTIGLRLYEQTRFGYIAIHIAYCSRPVKTRG